MILHFLNIQTETPLWMYLTFIVNWDLYFGPNDIMSLFQTVRSNGRPLTAGMNQEVVIVSEPFN